VPPTRLLPPRRRRAIPYLYTPAEIAALMHAAGQLRCPLHAATHRTLTGLMAVTGISLGEAIGLDRDDVDELHRLLRIIESKFGKSREVVLDDSVLRALHATAICATSCAHGRAARRSSFRPPARGCCRRAFTACSRGSCGSLGLSRDRRAVGRACTIKPTLLLCRLR
jgi:integrase